MRSTSRFRAGRRDGVPAPRRARRPRSAPVPVEGRPALDEVLHLGDVVLEGQPLTLAIEGKLAGPGPESLRPVRAGEVVAVADEKRPQSVTRRRRVLAHVVDRLAALAAGWRPRRRGGRSLRFGLLAVAGRLIPERLLWQRGNKPRRAVTTR